MLTSDVLEILAGSCWGTQGALCASFWTRSHKSTKAKLRGSLRGRRESRYRGVTGRRNSPLKGSCWRGARHTQPTRLEGKPSCARSTSVAIPEVARGRSTRQPYFAARKIELGVPPQPCSRSDHCTLWITSQPNRRIACGFFFFFFPLVPPLEKSTPASPT